MACPKCGAFVMALPARTSPLPKKGDDRPDWLGVKLALDLRGYFMDPNTTRNLNVSMLGGNRIGITCTEPHCGYLTVCDWLDLRDAAAKTIFAALERSWPNPYPRWPVLRLQCR